MKTGAKQDYIWNAAAGCLRAGETVFMTMVASRLVGLTASGIITIAFAVGNQLLNIGKLGVRNYQVTDTENRFSWKIYFVERMISVGIMVCCVILYLLYAGFIRHYSFEKLCSIGLVCMVFSVEAIEDVFWGLYQKNGYLAIGAQLFCVRWSFIFLSYLIILWKTRNMICALTACLLCSAITMGIMVMLTFSKATDRKIRFGRMHKDEWEK